jgi:hypothetical protein
MSCAAIKMQIAAKEADIAKTQAALKAHQEHQGYILSVFEHELYELNMKLQLAEAEEDEGWRQHPAEAEDDEGWNIGLAERQAASWEAKDDPCYHCGRAIHFCLCLEQEEQEAPIEGWGGEQRFNAEAPIFYPTRSQGTKLKWSLNAETYRVAVVKKNGILEVKRVTDGSGYCHDYMTCKCHPCEELALSHRLGAPAPPWRPRAPLTKTFFATEAAWRASLPDGGSVTVTEPRISDRALKALCMRPLVMLTDGGRLEELEKRFPGATMVLTTPHRQHEVESMNDSEGKQFRIFSSTTNEIRKKFSEFGASVKPNLMAEWRGMYIELTHLF